MSGARPEESKIEYYRVSPRFWNDRAVRDWSEPARMLALYMLTSPHRTTEGLFPMRKTYASSDLQWTERRLEKPWQELVDTGFMEWDPDAEVVLICQALRYQSPANPNMVKAAMKKLEAMGDTPLVWSFLRLAERFCEPLAVALRERFGEPPTRLYPYPNPNSSSDPSPEPSTVGIDPLSTGGASW